VQGENRKRATASGIDADSPHVALFDKLFTVSDDETWLGQNKRTLRNRQPKDDNEATEKKEEKKRKKELSLAGHENEKEGERAG